MNNLDRIIHDVTSVAEFGRRYAAYVAKALARLDFSAIEKFVQILEGARQAGLTGFDAGRMRGLCHLTIHVETPRGEYGPVESIHLMLNHLVTGYLRGRFEADFGSGAPPRGEDGPR
jgi:hypothetical protein